MRLGEECYSTQSGASRDVIDTTAMGAHSTDTKRKNRKPDNRRRNSGCKGSNVNKWRSKWALVSSIMAAYCVLNTTCPNGYTDMASTADAHSAVVFSTIDNDDNPRCALLQFVSCGESPDYQMSKHSTAAPGQANQHARGESTVTPENHSMDQAEWIPRTLPAVRQ